MARSEDYHFADDTGQPYSDTRCEAYRADTKAYLEEQFTDANGNVTFSSLVEGVDALIYAYPQGQTLYVYNYAPFDLSECPGDLDDIIDGSTYGKVLLGDLSGGHVVLLNCIGSQLPSDEDLAAYYAFDDGSGTQAVDNSGNTNHGTLTNSPTWTANGISGKCLAFDSYDTEYVDLDDDILDITGDFSISLWCYLSSTYDGSQSEQPNPRAIGLVGGSKVQLCMYNRAAFDVRISDSDDNEVIKKTTPASFAEDNWYHVCFNVSSGTTISAIYVNGVSQTLSTSYIGGTPVSRIGHGITLDDYGWHGYIDEVRLYDKELTETEIIALYLNPSGNASATQSMDGMTDGSAYGKLLLTDLSAGHLKLTSNVVVDGEWYDESGVEIDAAHGINIYGTDSALTTRATKAGTIECKVGSDGLIYAAAGKVSLGSTGLILTSGEAQWAVGNTITWKDGATTDCEICGFNISDTVGYLYLSANRSNAYNTGAITLAAGKGSWPDFSQVTLTSSGTGSNFLISINKTTLLTITTTEVQCEGELRIKEITTPTSSDGYGFVYPKSDNKLYYLDGAGTEHTVVVNDDTDVSGNSWVLDEDDMASDDDTKVATQQSIKAYVDGRTVGKTFVALETPLSIYRHWTSPISDTPRTATISSVSDDVITLTANEAYRFWAAPGETDSPDGNMYLKIANTSKNPVEYAWVKASPAVNQLQVTNSNDISGWANSETISTAQDGASSTYIELDISPIVPDGTTGILVKLQIQDDGTLVPGHLRGSALSKQGTSGTLVWCFMQVSGVMNGIYPSTPIQTNRHLFERDRATGVDTLKVFIVVLGYFI